VKSHSLIAIAAVLVTGVTYAGRHAQAAPAHQDAPGKTLYEENCRKCHGVRGVPPKTMKAKFPKIVTFDEEFFSKRSDDSVVTVLTKGKNQDMKSFKDKLTHDQMVVVAAYIRSLGTKEK
jgi:mono/diheme cytochrome c family protein